MEPTQFGNYTLLERISHGGMAEVYRAKSFGEAGFEREVALKLLLPGIASDLEFVNMLIDEAKIAGQLNHANIAQIFDLGVTDERYYIVQEYVSGQDLRSILQERADLQAPLDIATSCHIALKVCEGLYYAHNKQDQNGRPLNLVHRDISPHNILISKEGEVKIIDFGIAKAEGRSTQTMAGLVKGKFAYMSPEQIRGLPVDHRSDVFATGILLHEMLSNQSLFRRASEFETLKRARSATAEPPSNFNPKVQPALDTIVLKALARHVDDRYQSALELRDALWAFAREHNTFSESVSVASTNSSAKTTAPAIKMPRGGGQPGDGYEFDDDDDDDGADSATMVDPRLPFGLPGEEETDEDDDLYSPADDHDAQWARDVAGPLRSPFAMPSLDVPNRRTKKILAANEEETTSDHGSRHEASTGRYGQDAALALDEATAEKPLVASSREPSVSEAPTRGRAASSEPTVEEADRLAPRKEQSPRLALGIAATEAVAMSSIAHAPTQSFPQGALPPPGGGGYSSLQRNAPVSAPPSHSEGAPTTPMPPPAAPRPVAQPPPAQVFPAQAVPTHPQPGFAGGAYGHPAPGYPSQVHALAGDHSGAYLPGRPASGAEPYPDPRADSGAAPIGYPHADSGSAPYLMPASPSMPPRVHGRGPTQLYYVMAAVFLLLMAGAATVTLLITG